MNGWLRAFVFAVAPCSCTLGAHADVFQSVGQDVPVGTVFGSAPVSIAAGDLDGDDVLDIVVGTQFGGVSVRKGLGDGSFEETGQELLTPGSNDGVALGDLDNDGDLDLVVARRGDSAVSVRLNDGAGTFEATGQDLPVGNIWCLALADLDGDAQLDLIAGLTDGVAIHLGLPDGTLQSNGNALFLPGSIQNLSLVDLDGDDVLDLVAASYSGIGGDLYVRFGDGAGGFSPSGQDYAYAGGIVGLAVGDLDGDADLDVVVSHFGMDGIAVRLNDGTGDLSTVGPQLTAPSVGGQIVVEDTNFDGIADLVKATSIGSYVHVYLGVGPAQFAEEPQAVPISPFVATPPSIDLVTDVILADFDGDGDADLAASFITGLHDHFVAIRRNTTLAGFRRGDVNDDGVMDIADCVSVIWYLLYSGPTFGCLSAGDMNDDGVLDLSDPIHGLGYLFAGGAGIAEPFLACGVDITPDALGCIEFAGCP